MTKRYLGGYIGSRTYPLPTSGGLRGIQELITGISGGVWPVAGNWFNISTAATFYLECIELDSTGNIYVCGGDNGTAGAGGIEAILIKFNPAGQILWQVALGIATGERFYSCVLSASGSFIYAGGGSTTNNDLMLAKYNVSDGSLVWQQKSVNTGVDYISSLRALTDGSDGVMASAQYVVGGKQGHAQIKFNSNGTVNVARSYYYNTQNALYYSVALALNGTSQIVSTGRMNQVFASAYGTGIFNANYAMSDNRVVQWSLNNSNFPQDITIDSAGNAYVVGFNSISSPNTFTATLAKFDCATSLNSTLSWQRPVGVASDILKNQANCVYLESNTEIWTGTLNWSDNVGSYLFVTKVNAAGTIQSSHTITFTDGSNMWVPTRGMIVRGGYLYIIFRKYAKSAGVAVQRDNTVFGQMITAKFPSNLSSYLGVKGIFTIAVNSTASYPAPALQGTVTQTTQTGLTTSSAGIIAPTAQTFTASTTNYGNTLTPM